jgi:hypothetical protein
MAAAGAGLLMARWGAAIAVLALALAMAGCGGATSPDLSRVAQAAQATEGAGTAQFELTFDAKGLSQALSQTGSDVSFTASGAVDYDAQQTRMTIDLGSLSALLGAPAGGQKGLTLDAVLDGKVFYMRFPLLAGVVSADKPWLRMDLEELAKQQGADAAQLDQLSHVDPTQALAYLQGAGEFTEVGQETVRGVETTHYEGTIDLREAVDKAPSDQREQLERVLEDSGVTELPAEAWIDADGYLRKMTIDFAELGGMPGASFSIAMELFGFGEDVDIDVPSDDEVTDLSELSAKGVDQG